MRVFKLPGKRSKPDAMQFSPDGRQLAIQAFGGVDVLDTTTGTTQKVCASATSKRGTAGVGFTADSRGVVYFQEKVSSLNSVHVYALDTGQDRVLCQGKKVPWCSSGDIEISCVQGDGRLVFVAVNPQARMVEIAAVDPVSGRQQFAFARHSGFLRELAVSPDGAWVAGSTAKDLRVWSLSEGKRPNRASWRHHDREAYCFANLALSQGGAYVAVGGDVGGGQLRVWNVKTGEELVLKDRRRSGMGIAFAPDRPLLAFTQQGDANEVVFWDVKNQSEVNRFDWGLGPSEAVAFSPDGFRCATASQTWVVVWDVDA